MISRYFCATSVHRETYNSLWEQGQTIRLVYCAQVLVSLQRYALWYAAKHCGRPHLAIPSLQRLFKTVSYQNQTFGPWIWYTQALEPCKHDSRSTIYATYIIALFPCYRLGGAEREAQNTYFVPLKPARLLTCENYDMHSRMSYSNRLWGFSYFTQQCGEHSIIIAFPDFNMHNEENLCAYYSDGVKYFYR